MSPINLKRLRITIAVIVILGELILFADVKGKLPTGLFTFFHELQFIPSIIRLITPGTLFSFGFFIILILTLLYGRVYCSFFCPMGILQDITGRIRHRIRPNKRNRYMKPLNWIRYPLIIIVVVSLFFTGLLLINLFDPYANFGRISSNIYQPVMIWVNNIFAGVFNSLGSYLFMHIETKLWNVPAFRNATIVLLIVVILSVLKGRIVCNTLCPVGIVLGLLSKLSLNKIRIDNQSCNRCGKCQTACKANCINLKTLKIDETRCVSCYNCLPVCESDSIGYQLVFTKNINKQSDAAKRQFVKASFLYLLALPGLKTITQSFKNSDEDHANGEHEDSNGGHRKCYWSRGVASPPGSLSTERFKDKCVACHLCISVCPSKVLQPSYLDYGLKGLYMPKMDYEAGYCNYECTICGEVCPTGAILELPLEEKKLVQLGEVVFRKRLCIVESEGTACGSCSEHCPTQAVKMVPYTDDLTIPEIDPTICIGCGACEYACPVLDPHRAIFVMPNEEHITAEAPQQEAVEIEETEEFPF